MQIIVVWHFLVAVDFLKSVTACHKSR